MTRQIEAYRDTLQEIDLERARYLLSTDELLEEMLGEVPVDINPMAKANDISLSATIVSESY